MAITGTNRGSGNHNTGATSFTLSPASNFASGSWAVICIATDNAGPSGGAMSTFTVTDSLGNTWTRRASPLYDPGAASAGVEGAIFTTPMNGGTLTTSTTITVTFSNSPTAKAWALHEVVPSAGYQIGYVTSGVNTGAGTGTPTVTTGSITNGNMVIGAGFAESANTWTGDADTTNGSWSTQQANAAGTGTTGMSITSQRKVVSATATQTYNPTLTSADCILAYIVLTETPLPIAPAATNQGQSFDSPSLSQHNVLTPNAISQGHSFDSPTLTQHGVLVVQDMTQAHALGVPVLTQHNVLTPDAVAQAQALAQPTLSTGGSGVKEIYLPPVRPVRRQLVGAVALNINHPLAEGLVFAYAHNDNPFAADWFARGRSLPVQSFVTCVPGAGSSMGRSIDMTNNSGGLKAILFGSDARRVLLGSETEFTVAFWARWTVADGVNRFNALLAKAAAGTTNHDWTIGGSRYSFSAARAVWSVSTTSDFATNTNVALNKWYRCLLVKSGANAEWWLNGAQDATTTTFPAPAADTSGRELMFGRNATDSKNAFFGNAVGVMIWHRALTPAERVQDYIDCYAPFRPALPRTYWFGVAGAASITPNALAHAHTFDQPSLTQHNVLAVDQTAHAHSFGQPALTQHNVLTPDPLAQSETLGQPALTQHNVLTPDALAQSESFGQPTLTQHNVLSPNALNQSETFGAPTLTQHNILTPDPLAQSETLGQPTLTQHNVLTPDALSQAESFGQPTLTQHNVLTPDAMNQGETFGQPTLTQHNALTPDPLTQGETFGTPTLTQHNVLSPNATNQAHTFDQPTLTVGGSLSVQGLTQAQTLGQPALTQHNLLTPDALSQLHAFGTPSLTQHHVLVVQGTDQSHTFTQPTLTAAGALAVAALAQAHALESPALTQHSALTVASMTQQHSFSLPSLVQNYFLILQSLTQSQSLGTPTLTQHSQLVVQGMTQAQFMSVIDLSGLASGRLIGDIAAYLQIDGEIVSLSAIDGGVSTVAALVGDPDVRVVFRGDATALAALFGDLVTLQ